MEPKTEKEKLYTTSQVASMLGCHRATVVRMAGRKPAVGSWHGHQMAFDRSDVAVLRGRLREGPGNPAMTAGSEYVRKLSKKAVRTRKLRQAAAGK